MIPEIHKQMTALSILPSSSKQPALPQYGLGGDISPRNPKYGVVVATARACEGGN